MVTRLCRQGILELKPYIPGKPIEEVQREFGVTDIIKLASNESPIGPSPKAIEAMKQAVEKVALYPDGNCYSLRQAVATHLGVQQDCLIFGAGSDEVIHVIGLALLEDGDEVVIGDPTFSQYESASTLMECQCKKVALTNDKHNIDDMIACITERTKLVFIANPNNPTGTMLTHCEVEKLMNAIPANAVLVLDEAYTEYIENPDFPNAIPWILEGKNVICLRTFSKIYGLAGLRIGYGIAKPEIISYLERVRQPFNVNSIAQAAAIASLGDQEHLKLSRKMNAEGKQYFYTEFDRMGLPYAQSEANFVWVDVKQDCKQVFQELLKQGIIIRTGDIFGAPTHIRVSIGKPEENAKFINALEEVLSR